MEGSSLRLESPWTPICSLLYPNTDASDLQEFSDSPVVRTEVNSQWSGIDFSSFGFSHSFVIRHSVIPSFRHLPDGRVCHFEPLVSGAAQPRTSVWTLFRRVRLAVTKSRPTV